MITWSESLSSEPSAFMSNSSSMDVNFSPTDILAISGLNGFSTFDSEIIPPVVGGIVAAGGTGFAGFTGYTEVDPNTGVPSQVDLSQGPFGCTPLFSASNVDTVTFIIFASDVGSPTFVQAWAQIITLPNVGPL